MSSTQNQPLLDAIRLLTISPSENLRTELYRHLKHCLLYLIVDRLPAEFASSDIALTEDTGFTILTTAMEGGGVAILAFTDLESLQRYASGAQQIAMRAEDVLRTAVEQGYHAVILNPAGPWAGIPRDDIIEILNGAFS